MGKSREDRIISYALNELRKIAYNGIGGPYGPFGEPLNEWQIRQIVEKVIGHLTQLDTLAPVGTKGKYVYDDLE